MPRYLLSFLFLALVFSPVPSLSQPLRIYTEDNPPFSYNADDGVGGYAVDVVREICRRLKISEEIVIVPWARGYKGALEGPKTALFSTTRSPQREDLFKWVGPIYRQTWGLYGLKGSDVRPTSLDEARRVGRIGTYRNDAKEEFLLNEGFDNLAKSDSNVTNIQRLFSGDIDLVINSNLNMHDMVRFSGEYPDEVELVLTVAEVENYIAFSKDTPNEVVDDWQRTLDEMKSDGAFKNLMQKGGD